MADIRREMKKVQIKIIQVDRQKDRVEAQYVCRGYEFDMLLLGVSIKAEIEINMGEYMGVDWGLDVDV